MRSLAAFAVTHPVTIAMLIQGVVLLGGISYSKLGMELFPDLNSPRLYVELKAGERPPEEIERQFVERMESSAIRLRGTVRVSSVCRAGSAGMTVEYAWNADMDEAFLDLQKALAGIAQTTGVDELTVTQNNPNDGPVMLLALSHPAILDMNELRATAQQVVRGELVRLDGVADVEISGQEEAEVVITTDEYLLQAHGLTSAAIGSQIQSFNRTVSGGSIEERGTRYIVKGVGIFGDLRDFENLVVGYRQEQSSASTSEKTPIKLGDVARVALRNKKPVTIARINGRRCIGLAVYKESRANTIRVAHRILTALDGFKTSLPQYRFTVVQNQGAFIQRAVDEVKQSALIGILLAVGVIFVFLRRLGATLVVSAAIPISIIATFNLMYFNGLTVNLMTLGGLALGAGMLVDNAIVVVESIFRNLESGLDLKEAVVRGTAQVGAAITSSTVTTIVVFLPIVYLQGAAGELFKDQAWTVAFSLISSLAVAVVVIPMLAHRFLGMKPSAQRRGVRFPWYEGFLRKALARKWLVLVLCGAAAAVSFTLFPLIGSEFLPRTAGREFSINIRLPEGTNLERTSRTVGRIESLIRTVLGDEAETVFSQCGPAARTTSSSTALFEDENTASINVVCSPTGRTDAQSAIRRLAPVLDKTGIPDLRYVYDQSALQGIVGAGQRPIVIQIKGTDLAALEKLTRTAKERVAGITGIANLTTNFEQGAPEIEVKIDRLRAGVNSVNAADIAGQLQEKIEGRSVGQWERTGELTGIVLKLPPVSLGELERSQVRVGSLMLPLNELADIRRIAGPREIIRVDQARMGRITGDISSSEPFDRIVGKIETALTGLALPPHYRLEVAGEERQRRESFQGLFLALVLSVVLVYMVLASQFESLLHPLTIMLSVPLAGIGVAVAFLLAHRPLNIMAYIGMIMLAGIAVNGAIVLVDAIRQLSREGVTRTEAIVTAAALRVRPILMTTLTTILALVPLTFGFGEGAALRAPMALAVIGGLTTSTILTLVVIPCVYDAIEELRERLTGKAAAG